MRPWPLHRGQTSVVSSSKEGRSRWRDICIRPNWEMRPICTRARSGCSALRMVFSTVFWFSVLDMSMKSMTIKPPTSRKRSCRATSSAASRLVVKAVSSMSAPLVARAELMSIAISASVGSKTTEPPEGSLTVRLKALAI